MAEDDGAQEKSHDATPRRIEKAREEGNVANSQDAQALAVYLGFAIAMAIGGAWAATGLGTVLMAPLAHPEDLAREMLSGGAADAAILLMGKIAAVGLPILAAPPLLVILLLLAQGNIVIAPKKVAPKLSRINPIDNAKQKYGIRGLVEFLKSSVKLGALSIVLGLVIWRQADDFARYTHIEGRLSGALLDDQFWALATGILIVAAVIAFFDVIWQRNRHLAELRMTHEELKEEQKEAEGDPHLRQSRKERARKIATNRMLNDVPKADVVIANPTHYAVALTWDRRPGSAPVCVAKGSDDIALAIRGRAEAAEVPVHEDPPTARALHGLVEVGQEIPQEHYKAVAAAIVFADKIRQKRAERVL
ncbi:MAG: flagellar type III secretion system protein FlhB [Pseudomonadota bacterium]